MPGARTWTGAPLRVLVAAVLALVVAGAATTIRPSTGLHAPTATSAVVDPAIPTGSEVVDVVVQARAGMSAQALASAVSAAGGELVETLPIIDGAEVRITGDQVQALAGQTGILAVTLDRTGSFDTVSYDETGTASSFVGTSGGLDAWAGGHLGDGVGVAVIDTGISEMPDFAGRLVHGPDLSGEGTLVDTYGHGTVMAGIIGGSGVDSSANTGGAYTGIAPESTLVSVKVAGANGAADVSTLLQAMHFVSAYQDQFDIRVLNLSWGTTSTQDPAVDPLNYAVERLWNQGIVVVVAAGNSGPSNRTITKPADDPLVITAGAFNDQGTTDLRDDEMVGWSSQGPTAHGVAKPDLVAPGRRLIAQRSHGSTVAEENPKALMGPSYIRGSGSSQAAAVTSGAVALLLDARPELTPDQVKAVLTGTANPLKRAGPMAQGAGRLDLAEALVAEAGPPQWQVGVADGSGSIDASRGGVHVETDCDGDGTTEVIQGEIDVRCEDWNGSAWTGSAWTGSAWTGSAWTGSAWTGSAWTGSAWTGSAWTGSAWTGSAWTGSAWTTGAYDADDELFATAWWGLHPPIGDAIPGENTPMPVYIGMSPR